MKFTNFSKMIQVAAFGAAAVLGTSGTAFAGTISVSYLGAGVQAPTSTSFVETFNNGLGTGNTTTFNGSTITGTFSGGFTLPGFNQYGGAGGSGSFIDAGAKNVTYTLTLDTPVNYFGYWLSALDAGNQLQLEDASGNVLFTFVPQDLIDALGTCPKIGTVVNPYCGNPNTDELGNNSDQLYAYVQFFDTTSDISKIVYTETISAGYEADNFSVDNLTSGPGGTTLGAVPEPSSLIMLGTGVLGVAGSLRRKLFAR
jgi:hypothetical protein